MQAGSNPEAFAAAGATAEQFLDSWASSYFHVAPLGRAWIMQGPGLNRESGPGRVRVETSNGQAVPFTAAPYTNGVMQLISHADVVTFTTSGHARLGDDLHGTDYLLNDGARFCTKDGGCACPPGRATQGPPLSTLDATPMLAVTAGPTGTRGIVQGQSLDEFCKPQPTTPAARAVMPPRTVPTPQWLPSVTAIPSPVPTTTPRVGPSASRVPLLRV